MKKIKQLAAVIWCVLAFSGSTAAEELALPGVGTLQWQAPIHVVAVTSPFRLSKPQPSVSPATVAAKEQTSAAQTDVARAFSIYQLQADRPQGFRTAWFIHANIPKDENNRAWEMYFQPQLSTQAANELMQINELIYQAEPMINMFIYRQMQPYLEQFVQETRRTRKAMGDQAVTTEPYLPLYVHVLDPEPLVRVPNIGAVVYSAGARIVPKLDNGLVIPYYLQVYALENQDYYSFLFLVVRDSERDIFKKSLARGVRRMTTATSSRAWAKTVSD